MLRWVSSLRLAVNGCRQGLEGVIDGAEEGSSFSQGPFLTPIRTLYLTAQERLLIVGLESGEVRFLSQDSEYLKRRLTQKLTSIGILSNFDEL